MTDVKKVSGVGPKAAERLSEANITTAEGLANATIEQLVEVGLTAKRAEKFITAASLLVGAQDGDPPKEKVTKAKAAKEEVAEEVTEKPKKKSKKVKKEEVAEEVTEKPKKKSKKVKKEEVAEEGTEKPKKKSKKALREDQRSPVAKGIPTKKKRGVQVRSISDDGDIERVEKKDGWGVVAKTLTEEEKTEKKARLERMNRASKITRPIPTMDEVVKAKKSKKKVKTKRPLKQEKTKKTTELKRKKVKEVIDYYSQKDLYPVKTGERRRNEASTKTGTAKPRAELKRDTLVGKISSHRRSRRVIHTSQVIVKLSIDFKPDTLVGQKVYFTYPDNQMRVSGSISKRFGKVSSGKVIVNFKKGIRSEGIHQQLFIK